MKQEHSLGRMYCMTYKARYDRLAIHKFGVEL